MLAMTRLYCTLILALLFATPTLAQEDGQSLYVTRCQSCHQMSGQGIPGVFPPLDESDWVTGDKGNLIRILLHGVQGEMTVKGVKYSGAMPPWNTFLDDAQIAALLTYIRGAWNNSASPVTTQEVAALRASTKDRKAAWTEAELKAAAEAAPASPFDLFKSVKPDTTGGNQ